MRLALASLLAVFVNQPSYAFDFKGIVLGQPATVAQVEEKLGIRCGAGIDSIQVCNGGVTIAQERATVNLVINDQGVVRRINLSLSPESFDVVAPLLIEKFGAPTATTKGELQNRMGAKFEQTTHLWKDDQENHVLYSRYAGTVDKSFLSFTTKEDRGLLANLRGNRRSDL
mgnify:FL=1